MAAEMCGMLFSVWKLFSILLVTLGVEFRRPLSLSPVLCVGLALWFPQQGARNIGEWARKRTLHEDSLTHKADSLSQNRFSSKTCSHSPRGPFLDHVLGVQYVGRCSLVHPCRSQKTGGSGQVNLANSRLQ